jgi:hypothetical protein
MAKLTKSEIAIISKVKSGNAQGALVGLGTDPTQPSFSEPEYRFVKRLYEAKKIVWVTWSKDLGAGWALPGMFGKYYVEFDEDDDMYYVFHTSTNGEHAYSSWCDEGQAQEDADRRNGVEKP